jgi:D-Tyr-tRNAtyr deacylase
LVPYKNVIELTAQEKLIANIKDLEDEEVLVIYNFTLMAGARKTHKDTDNFTCHGRRYKQLKSN